MDKKQKPANSLVVQVAVYFGIGLLLTVLLSFFTLKNIADQNVIREKETLCSGLATEVDQMVRETNSYEWVINYLIEHRNDSELDIEYDKDDLTRVKHAELVSRHPGLILSDVTPEELDGFSEEDKRAFAEIIYNQWILRLNAMKKSYNVAFLYFLATDDTCQRSIFIANASDGIMKRSTKQGDAYILGTTVNNNSDQIMAFMQLHNGGDHLVYTEGYLDGYRYLYKIGHMNIIAGMTFELTTVREEVESQTYQSIYIFVLLQLLLSFFCLLLIYSYALNPLKVVTKSVYKYAEKKDGINVRKHLAKIKNKNEIGQLAGVISDMTSEIDAHMDEIRTITAEKERISTELNVATKIQADMLPNIFPPFPQIREFDIYAVMHPAKEVGGDFYDFFMIDDDHVALVIADVSGKGVPAALFMVVAKTLIKNRTMLGGTPSEILYDVNNHLCEGNTSEFFVTVWMAIVNIRTGKGIAANAGHEHPVLRRAGGDYELIKYPHSLAVAAIEGCKFKEHEFELHPGDRLFVYTDGVPEASDKDNNLFGSERMIESLNNNKAVGAYEVLSSLKEDLAEFVGGAVQFDDITMLVFDYKGDVNGREEGT